MNAVQAKTFRQWWRIKLLHNSSFSAQDRKSLSIYRARQEQGKVDVWYFEENDQFIGYVITTPGRTQVLINYFAVANAARGQSKSGVMLKILQHEYQGKGLFAEVDYISPGTLHKDVKERRRQFYFKHGFEPLGVTATYVDNDLELVGINCPMTYESYYRFYVENYNLYTATCLSPCKAALKANDAVYQ